MSKRKPKKEEAPSSAYKEAEEPSESPIRGEFRVVPIKQVRPNGFNYNRQSAFIYEKMLDSLREFGFVDPIDVRSGNEEGAFGYFEVIGGEHRLKAAEELGYKEVPVNDLGCVENVMAKKLCIVLNETKGKPDNDALAALIADLDGQGADLEVLPFDLDELDAFIESTNVNLDDMVDAPEKENGEDSAKGKDGEETIIGVMGLLDISANKEAFLVSQFKKCLNVMQLKSNPVRGFEKMMDTVIEG